MKIYACRLLPGKDFRDELFRIISEQKIQAGFIITCVGSFSTATLRMAGATPGKQDIRTKEGEFEVVSAVGTFSQDGMHVHMGLASRDGEFFGGHLKNGCIINTTMELVIGDSPDWHFSLEKDPETGFEEFAPKKR